MIGAIERRSACDRRQISHTDRILKRVGYPLGPGAAEEKLQETHRLLQRSAMPRLDVKRIYRRSSRPGLRVDDPRSLDGSRGLLGLGFHLLICGHMDQGVQARALLWGYVELHCCPHAAPRKVFLVSLIFFILFDMLSCSRGSRRWIISQMDTSDLLENISCHCLNKHKDELVS